MSKENSISSLAISLVTIALFIAFPVFAQTDQNLNRGQDRAGQMQRQNVVGTVSVINGNTITISGKQGLNNKNTSATVFTVDATNAKVTKNNVASTVSSIVVGDTVVVQGTINGTNIVATNIRDGVMMPESRGEMGINGTVSAINGTSLTVTSKARPNGAVQTTYTVDASKATVTKNGAASSVSSIAIGDTVMIQGTVTGTNVIATKIRDGLPQNQPEIQGNGQPVVAGTVTAVSGNTITITNKSNVTYTIDATNAKFVSAGTTNSTISSIVVGDNVVVQGTINGNSVVASSVIDQKAKTNESANKSEDKQESNRGFMGGMMNGVGNFFKHLFGF